MNSTMTPTSLLQQIAQIQYMEPGSLHIIREGPCGPYYNHQSYEDGKHVSRYVPQAQVPQLQEAIDGYKRFEDLVENYAKLMVQKTRDERSSGLKKKRPNSSSPKTRKSKS